MTTPNKKSTKIVPFCVVAHSGDGKASRVIELPLDEYLALERAMQWPEDLAFYDRLNRPINGAEIGAGI